MMYLDFLGIYHFNNFSTLHSNQGSYENYSKSTRTGSGAAKMEPLICQKPLVLPLPSFLLTLLLQPQESPSQSAHAMEATTALACKKKTKVDLDNQYSEPCCTLLQFSKPLSQFWTRLESHIVTQENRLGFCHPGISLSLLLIQSKRTAYSHLHNLYGYLSPVWFRSRRKLELKVEIDDSELS